MVDDRAVAWRVARRTFYEVEIVTATEVRELILTPRGRIVEDNLES